ncbi:MAG: glycosyltransferase family 9 protein [Crocinitomicaceae bacterium]|nr:glycosyltransferase family 9 protein [Crocinitomicaceae bacterium]
MIDLNNKRILISRTDSIGDVVLTLPICAWIKKKFPSSTIIFLGNTYTQPILECFPQIDEVMEWSALQQMPEANKVDVLRAKKIDVCIHVFPRRELASLVRKAKIETRVGTSHRSYHLLTCNVRLNFSRKSSDFHESQLNFELLKPFGIKELPSLEEINELIQSFKIPQVELPEAIEQMLNNPLPKIIFHPRSLGSAMEWPIEKYIHLTNSLLEKGYAVYYTGTEADGVSYRSLLPEHAHCFDTSGKMSLSELIVFISRCDQLLACSTGPLHLAGILGLKTIGLYSNRRPIHPGRWKALGKNVHILVNEKENATKKSTEVMQNIKVDTVEELLLTK